MAKQHVHIGTSSSIDTQISTGAILGGGRTNNSFYINLHESGWQETYTHPQNEPEAAGQLMNFRMIQAAIRNDPTGSSNVEDMSETDAENNTDLFIDNIPLYRPYGLLAAGVGMQGGNPQTTEISQTGFLYDKQSASCSGFASNGSLKSTYQGRLERIIEAMDAAGMVVILGVFYFRQAHALATMTEVNAAIDNTCDWIIEKGYRNIIIDVANESGPAGSTHWDSTVEGGNTTTGPTFLTDSGIATMIERFQDNFVGQPWRPPVGSSVFGIDVGSTPLMRAACDVWIGHSNERTLLQITNECIAVQADSNIVGPVLINEDEKGETMPPTATMRDNEQSSCDNSFDQKCSWGAMIPTKFQRFHIDTGPSEPFWWEIGTSTDITTGTNRERYANFTRSHLEHIDLITGGLPSF